MHEIKQVDDFNFKIPGRVYTTPVGYCASVTTILGETFNKNKFSGWRKNIGDAEADLKMKCGANRGTSVHNAVEAYLNKENYREHIISNEANEAFKAIVPLLDRIDEVLHVEIAVHHPIAHYAGRVDIIARINGEVKIIDIKTSNSYKRKSSIKDYFLQCAAYAAAYNRTLGIDRKDEHAKGAEIYMGVSGQTQGSLFEEDGDTIAMLAIEYKKLCQDFYNMYPHVYHNNKIVETIVLPEDF